MKDSKGLRGVLTAAVVAAGLGLLPDLGWAAETPAKAAPAAQHPARRLAASATEDFVIFLRPSEDIARIAEWSGRDAAAIRTASGIASDAPVPPGTRVVLQLTAERAAAFIAAREAALGPRKRPPPPDVPPTVVETGEAGDAAAPKARVTVKVRQGEMLGLYAEWGGVTLKQILEANPTLNPHRIAPGQKIVIPVPFERREAFREAREAWYTARTAPKPAPGPAPTPPAATPTPTGPVDTCARLHRMRKGDSVWALAKRWGVTVGAIRRCNPGIDLERVPAGNSLYAPDAAKL